MGTAGSRQGFLAEKTADAVLEVDDEVTFLQFGEINVEGGADAPGPADAGAPERLK